jgi:hypothetical protein
MPGIWQRGRVFARRILLCVSIGRLVSGSLLVVLAALQALLAAVFQALLVGVVRWW